jgi:class 3 adenylate cyclase
VYVSVLLCLCLCRYVCVQVRPTDFERHFLRFKAPHMLPAQMVHACLMVICTAGMFGVDAQELFAARGRGEDVGLLLVVGIGGNVVCLCGMVVLTVVYCRRKQAGAGPVSDTGAAVQDATAVIIWMMTVVFLEVVQAFAKGATISSWAFVIAGFLRTHTLHNLLCNGLALHPQPLGFMVGVCWLLAARVLSHIMWDRRNAAGELVTLLSAQCGATEEWKPRALVSVFVVLIMTTGAYFKRQLLERSAVRQLVATVGLRERVWEIASSLLPPHVIPILEGRASRRASVPGNLRRVSQADTGGGSIFSLSEKHDSVIILHADVVGFTGKCAKSGVGEVFESISMLFNALDDLCRKFELTKIETIGDAYWCSHGLSTRATPSDARKMLLFAAALRKIARSIKIAGDSLQVRIGIHVGPMLGGIVGNRFPRYHLFGPHAKVGQVLEQAGNAEASLVSDTFRHLLMQREIISDDSPPAAVSAQGRKYLQKVGSVSSTETASVGRRSLPRGGSSSSSECGLPSESWNVMAWSASSEQVEGSAVVDGRHLPAEIGPVILESDKKNRETHGVVLRRHEGLTQSAVSSLDPAVTDMVLPAWFAFDIEHESDDHRARSHPDADVTVEVSSRALHDANALAGEGGETVLAIFPDATIDAERGGNGTVPHVESDRSTATGFRSLSQMACNFPFKISPASSRTHSTGNPHNFQELTVARFN